MHGLSHAGAGALQAGLTPRDWALRKGFTDMGPLLKQSSPHSSIVPLERPGITAMRKGSISSLESGVDSVISSSASAFAAAAAARPVSLSVAAPLVVTSASGMEGDGDEVGGAIPHTLSAGASTDSPWARLTFFGRRSSFVFDPRHVEGYMHKRGGLVKNWKMRYCVLDAERLSYFGKQVRLPPRASLCCGQAKTWFLQP